MSDKTTHTPGPWRAGIAIAGKINVAHLDCTPGAITQNLCWVAARPSWSEEGKANARLISAAPDLLDALVKCAEQLEMITGMVHDERCALLDARIAIAKATEQS